MKRALIVIDAGSSSVRCIAYAADNLWVLASQSCKQSQVRTNDGRVLWERHQILETVDTLVDNVLRLEALNDYTVTGLGFSTFVMNLIGLDSSGKPVAEEATLSYACNTTEVNQEVEHLKR